MPHSIVNTTSSDGTCEVAIGELGSPMFFGPSTITIKVSWDTDSNVIGAENVTEIKTDLHNDGKSLDSDNFTVTWHGNRKKDLRREPCRSPRRFVYFIPSGIFVYFVQHPKQKTDE